MNLYEPWLRFLTDLGLPPPHCSVLVWAAFWTALHSAMRLTWWPSKLAATDWSCQVPWLTWNRRLDLTMTCCATNVTFSLISVWPAQIFFLHLICASTIKKEADYNLCEFVSSGQVHLLSRYNYCPCNILWGTNVQEQGVDVHHKCFCHKSRGPMSATNVPKIWSFGSFPATQTLSCLVMNLKKANQTCYKRTQIPALGWKVWMMSC